MIGRFHGLGGDFIYSHPYIEKLERDLEENIIARDKLNKLIKSQRRQILCFLNRLKKEKDS